MSRLTSVGLAGIILFAGLLASSGCQSTRGGASASPVACDKCNVAVRKAYTVPGYEGPRQMGYLTCNTPGCGYCKEAEAKYEATGTFDPVCKCGGTMRLVTK